jgi:hypothetical protein
MSSKGRNKISKHLLCNGGARQDERGSRYPITGQGVTAIGERGTEDRRRGEAIPIVMTRTGTGSHTRGQEERIPSDESNRDRRQKTDKRLRKEKRKRNSITTESNLLKYPDLLRSRAYQSCNRN